MWSLSVARSLERASRDCYVTLSDDFLRHTANARSGLSNTPRTHICQQATCDWNIEALLFEAY